MNKTLPILLLCVAAATAGITPVNLGFEDTSGTFSWRINGTGAVSTDTCRVRLRGDNNAGDLITLRLTSAGLQRFSSPNWVTEIPFAAQKGVAYAITIVVDNLDALTATAAAFTADMTFQIAGNNEEQSFRCAFDAGSGTAVDIRSAASGFLQARVSGTWQNIVRLTDNTAFSVNASHTRTAPQEGASLLGGVTRPSRC